MNKYEFKKIAKQCPWYFHNGQPRCSGNGNINCAKNKCAMLFWIVNRPPNKEVTNVCSCPGDRHFKFLKGQWICVVCGKPENEQR